MKTKAKLILKSLTDLPANALSLAASLPERAVSASKQVFAPAVQFTPQEIQSPPRRSATFIRNPPWQRGGLNE